MGIKLKCLYKGSTDINYEFFGQRFSKGCGYCNIIIFAQLVNVIRKWTRESPEKRRMLVVVVLLLTLTDDEEEHYDEINSLTLFKSFYSSCPFPRQYVLVVNV